MLLAGCTNQAGVLPANEPDYKSSRRLPPLEIPPELGSGNIGDAMAIPEAGDATWSEYGSGEGAGRGAATPVLPEFANARVQRSGSQRWLVVRSAPDALWPRIRDFWLQQGFVIEIENPGVGIMETDWAEERTDFTSGVFGRLLGELSSALGGAATRDKFRTRIERGEAASALTEIYVSHRGAEEVAPPSTYQNMQSGAEARRVWQPRPSDPELEAEMLGRMLVFFGMQEQQAREVVTRPEERPERARILRDDSGAPLLLLDDEFSRAWRRTGLALDRIGFTVEDRDRTRGLYFVRYVDPDRDLGRQEGFFASLAFWREDPAPEQSEYRIRLIGDEQTTRVLVLDPDGERNPSQTADRILGLLHRQLR